jgi:hypothetical protein
LRLDGTWNFLKSYGNYFKINLRIKIDAPFVLKERFLLIVYIGYSSRGIGSDPTSVCGT